MKGVKLGPGNNGERRVFLQGWYAVPKHTGVKCYVRCRIRYDMRKKNTIIIQIIIILV